MKNDKRTNAWAAVIAAWIGAGACGSAQMAGAPQATAGGDWGGAAAAADEPAPGAIAMMAERTARPGGDAPTEDAAALNAKKTGEWNVVREFAPATYDPADDGPRRDFRETIFWAPEVRTDANGRARIEFPTSDAITSFRITAEGLANGLPGHAETTIASRLPLSLAANLPVEVTTGDRIALPVTITNNTATGIDATVRAIAGAAITGTATRTVHVRAHAARTVSYQLRVTGADGADAAGDVELAVDAGTAHDGLKRSLKIVPNGFPAQTAVAGTVAGPVRNTISVPATAVPGSVHTTIKLYPSPIATMTAAVDSIVREPSGCFEQASSANYPNVMVLSYLQTAGGGTTDSSSTVAAQATTALDHGYQLLTGYESAHHGFEWFGADPGHEALSAYGLLEFKEMAKVYPGQDPKLVERTAAWLRSRRDGKGGYQRNGAAIDSFGRASAAVTDAYITYALAEAGERDLDHELDRAREVAANTTDPYVLALSAAALLAVDAADPKGLAALATLAARQGKDGRFTGATQSITMSGGEALDIETTALATLAMMKAKTTYREPIRLAVEWITKQRSQWGGFSSTQATILALKALTAQAAASRVPAGASITVSLNGTKLGTTMLDDADGAIELPDLGPHLASGDNVIELRASTGARLDYSLGVRWYDAAPTSSPQATVAVAAALDRARVRVGRPVRLTATIENVTSAGQPMTLARVGIPGGLHYQPWQLDELVDKHVVDFVETREREVILYLRQLKPGEKRRVPIELLAQVPGHYVAPPSSAYLYYTDEHRQYAPPLAIDVTRPPARKKPAASTKTTTTAPTK